ncbi:hypothetical protein COW38_02980 [Candidatus Collierbacteria bacterium CG17_big_fil_post_rev_8_21_14_2_50_45_7]|uniref:Uncharacterized protein n=2 Tax=Candidatus Collieribacteriota TaxID=1752725 RepID=A0A2H0WZ98_9BACT|nr:MAG: hypothetical protein COT54_01785 [Candidatus Collierbacteria bacterium CG09_land_8_20_14_0_10_46_12]PIW07307.1 MAG: hypothetical protein COW38_02980 [Candidatus Collierbacteria bacterium CG17_big_fil_post_rev_8_21_14_2_50_45_7]
MLNKRVQTLFDQDTWQLVHESALNMNVSFGEALRQAANYAFKTNKIHNIQGKKPFNSRLLAAQKIAKIRKSLNLHLSVEEILAMRHYGHKH